MPEDPSVPDRLDLRERRTVHAALTAAEQDLQLAAAAISSAHRLVAQLDRTVGRTPRGPA